MATKKTAAYKRRPARKQKADDDNDPPIIIGGGGGPIPEPGDKIPRGSAKNIVEIAFGPPGGPITGKLAPPVDGDKTITGVTVSFPGTDQAPIEIKNYVKYRIWIKFQTQK